MRMMGGDSTDKGTKKEIKQQILADSAQLTSLYLNLYKDSEKEFDALLDIMTDAVWQRRAALRKLDLEETKWVNSAKTIGMMLYVDLFAESMDGLIDKLDYLEALGITLIHLMPILEKRVGENDGGYAVKNYREIDPQIGNMAQFNQLVSQLHKRGMRVCIDYVINHTANDHEWALKAVGGEEKYQNYYWFFDNEEIPMRFEKTLNQVFPTVAPGNFTYLSEVEKWVMTTFYPFQWDLNYQNPMVLNEMIDILLFLANQGVDMIRLDAIPYIWKALGTNSRNMPEAHQILKIFREVISICAPSVALLGEAIVSPETILTYFGEASSPECHVLYNASYMVEIWNAIATRDARHIALMPHFDSKRGASWINYARCHDDIGWGLDENRIRQLGFDFYAHKNYLIDFYYGILKDSFSAGELYEYDPVTGDARNSGTLASLAGLEKALATNDRYMKELSFKRIELIHALFILKQGIPMIYAGDELGQLNDYSYKMDRHKAHDSRWLHRGSHEIRLLTGGNKIHRLIYERIKSLIAFRKNLLASNEILEERLFHIGNEHLLGRSWKVDHPDQPFIQLFNFSEDRQWLYTSDLKRNNWHGIWVDQLTEKEFNFDENTILLGPYEYFLLKFKK